MDNWEKCHVSSCDSPALLSSKPPSCLSHIGDVDKWYESTVEGLASTNDEFQKLMLLALLHELYKQSLFTDSIGEELYKDFKNRVDPREEIQFSFTDVIYFVLLAAASGVVGNAAYDAIKTAISKIRDRKNNLEETFSEIIRPQKYEELRRQEHLGKPAQLVVDVEIEVKIKRKYRLLFQRQESNFPETESNDEE